MFGGLRTGATGAARGASVTASNASPTRQIHAAMARKPGGRAFFTQREGAAICRAPAPLKRQWCRPETAASAQRRCSGHGRSRRWCALADTGRVDAQAVSKTTFDLRQHPASAPTDKLRTSLASTGTIARRHASSPWVNVVSIPEPEYSAPAPLGA